MEKDFGLMAYHPRQYSVLTRYMTTTHATQQRKRLFYDGTKLSENSNLLILFFLSSFLFFFTRLSHDDTAVLYIHNYKLSILNNKQQSFFVRIYLFSFLIQLQMKLWKCISLYIYLSRIYSKQ